MGVISFLFDLVSVATLSEIDERADQQDGYCPNDGLWQN